VGRGIITIEEAQEINDRLLAEIQENGGRIDRVFMCSHAPSAQCDCRKPEPGLFFQATEALSLDLERSVMVGDAFTDLLAAKAAGVPRLALVRTGRGEEQIVLAEKFKFLKFALYANLLDALEDLVPEIA
jgi:D-glycero-D-manno-heptose 1,7-bisphosphate phosphatase